MRQQAEHVAGGSRSRNDRKATAGSRRCSSTGIVAEGAEWSSGAVAVHWPGHPRATSVWANIRDLEQAHRHDGATEIRWLDDLGDAERCLKTGGTRTCKGSTLEDMHLTFLHDPRGECLTLIRRADGAVFTLSSYSRKHRVPHDLAHAVTERELGMPDGIFGCIAAGAVFDSMRQTAGKKRHDAKIRSTRILKAAKNIGVSEVISGVIHEAVEKDRATPYALVREAWGITQQDPCPYLDTDLDRATETLRELSHRWQANSDPLVFPWPKRLQAADAGRQVSS